MGRSWYVDMLVETIPVGVFRCNCTIVACETTRKAVVIDPGDEPERILAIIRANGLDVTHILHTHAHLDHIMGTFDVVQGTGALAHLHDGDRPLWDNIDRIAASYHIPTPKTPPLAEPLEDGKTFCFGSADVHVVHTPGHTLGSCCFTVGLENGRTLLLSGDTLFRGKIGLASQPFRNSERLIASIRDRLFALNDDTQVIPGHGPRTEIGVEKRHNPFLA